MKFFRFIREEATAVANFEEEKKNADILIILLKNLYKSFILHNLLLWINGKMKT